MHQNQNNYQLLLLTQQNIHQKKNQTILTVLNLRRELEAIQQEHILTLRYEQEAIMNLNQTLGKLPNCEGLVLIRKFKEVWLKICENKRLLEEKRHIVLLRLSKLIPTATPMLPSPPMQPSPQKAPLIPTSLLMLPSPQQAPRTSGITYPQNNNTIVSPNILNSSEAIDINDKSRKEQHTFPSDIVTHQEVKTNQNTLQDTTTNQNASEYTTTNPNRKTLANLDRLVDEYCAEKLDFVFVPTVDIPDSMEDFGDDEMVTSTSAMVNSVDVIEPEIRPQISAADAEEKSENNNLKGNRKLLKKPESTRLCYEDINNKIDSTEAEINSAADEPLKRQDTATKQQSFRITAECVMKDNKVISKGSDENQNQNRLLKRQKTADKDQTDCSNPIVKRAKLSLMARSKLSKDENLPLVLPQNPSEKRTKVGDNRDNTSNKIDRINSPLGKCETFSSAKKLSLVPYPTSIEAVGKEKNQQTGDQSAKNNQNIDFGFSSPAVSNQRYMARRTAANCVSTKENDESKGNISESRSLSLKQIKNCPSLDVNNNKQVKKEKPFKRESQLPRKQFLENGQQHFGYLGSDGNKKITNKEIHFDIQSPQKTKEEEFKNPSSKSRSMMSDVQKMAMYTCILKKRMLKKNKARKISVTKQYKNSSETQNLGKLTKSKNPQPLSPLTYELPVMYKLGVSKKPPKEKNCQSLLPIKQTCKSLPKTISSSHPTLASNITKPNQSALNGSKPMAKRTPPTASLSPPATQGRNPMAKRTSPTASLSPPATQRRNPMAKKTSPTTSVSPRPTKPMVKRSQSAPTQSLTTQGYKPMAKITLSKPECEEFDEANFFEIFNKWYEDDNK